MSALRFLQQDDVETGVRHFLDDNVKAEALCTHLPKGEPDPNGVWQTIASVVYDLRAGSAYICKGTPCCGEYLKYDL